MTCPLLNNGDLSTEYCIHCQATRVCYVRVSPTETVWRCIECNCVVDFEANDDD